MLLRAGGRSTRLGSRRVQVGLQRRELGPLGLDDRPPAPWPRTPGWPACPRCGRSRPPDSARRASRLRSAAARVERAAGQHVHGPAGDRRPSPPGPRRHRPRQVEAGQAGDLRAAARRSRPPPAGPGRARPPARRRVSRQPRRAWTAAITPRDVGLGGRVDARRVGVRTPGGPPAGPGCRARAAHSSSVTNGISGWASASVSDSTCSSVADRSARSAVVVVEARLDQLQVPVAQLAVDEVVERERRVGEVVGVDLRVDAARGRAPAARGSSGPRPSRDGPRAAPPGCDAEQDEPRGVEELVRELLALRDLLGRVAHVLRRGHRQQAEAHRVGAVRVDLVERVDARAQRLAHPPAVGRLDDRVDVDVARTGSRR